MTKEAALKRAHSLFPLGTKVEWSAKFYGKMENGRGEVFGHVSGPEVTGFVYIIVRPENGRGQR